MIRWNSSWALVVYLMAPQAAGDERNAGDPSSLMQGNLLRGSTTEVSDLVFTSDGRTLISASLDGFIRFWDPERETERLRVRAHKGGVYGVALSPDSKWLASAGQDRRGRLWDRAKVKEVHTLEGHRKEVIAVAFAPDGKTLASASADRTIRLWDVATGQERHVLKGHTHKVTALAFSPDGKVLASGGIVPAETANFIGSTQSDEIRLWDPATGKELRRLSARGHRVAFADNQRLVAAGMYVNFLPPGQTGLTVGAHSIDGGSRTTVWDLARNKERFRLEEYWTALAVSADGQFMASGWGSQLHMGGIVAKGSKARGIYLWEMATGKQVCSFPVPQEAATVLAIAPDASKLVAGSNNGEVRFFNLAPPGWKSAATAKGLTVEELEQRWAALAGEDSVAAYAAIWDLTAAGDSTVAFLKDRLPPAAATDERIRRLIADLDSEQFGVREQASRELKDLGADAEPNLQKALQDNPSPDLRKRVEALLEALPNTLAPEPRRRGRAVLVLERIGTPAARERLRALAQGASEAAVSRQAKAALERQGQRPGTASRP